MDDERVETNLKNLREGKAGGYNPYEEEIDPLTGDLTSKGNHIFVWEDNKLVCRLAFNTLRWSFAFSLIKELVLLEGC